MAAGPDTRVRALVSVVVIGLAVGGLVVPVTNSAAGTAGVATTTTTTGVATTQQSQPETDNTVTRIEVFANGSARWTIRIRTRLDTDQRVTEYTAFQARFRNNTSQYLGPFRTRIQGVVANAQTTTGRQMNATNFAATTEIQEVPRRWGVVTYEFTWQEFAPRANGRVRVGDVFQGGFFIAANDTLQVVAPDGYEVTRTEPTPDSRDAGVVIWSGREDFADGRPTVELAPASSQPSGGIGLLERLGPLAVVGVAVVALLGVGGAVLYGRRDSDAGTANGPAAATDGAESAGASPSTDSDAAAANEPVLTDEERVLAFLEANDGRVRQAAIAEEFDWSASKTSRVIGRMADEEAVEKLQLGRENLVTLPDERP